jgi:hypothetical protein
METILYVEKTELELLQHEGQVELTSFIKESYIKDLAKCGGNLTIFLKLV